MSRATSLLRVAGVLLAAWLPVACVHVGHAPRVEPGPRYFINVSGTRNADVQDENLTVFPAIIVGAARGWVFENGAAASLGAQLPPLGLLFVSAEPLEQLAGLVMVDAYVQPRRAAPGGIDAGIGALASTSIIMPYMQVGRAGHGGIFTTQGVLVPYRDFERIVYWLPSVSYRSVRADGSRAVDYYIGAMVGREKHDVPARVETQWAATFGVVLELRRRR